MKSFNNSHTTQQPYSSSTKSSGPGEMPVFIEKGLCDPQNSRDYCPCSWLPTRIEQWDSFADIIIHFGHGTWRSQAGTALEVSSLMDSSSSIGRYYVRHQERNIFNSPSSCKSFKLQYGSAGQDMPNREILALICRGYSSSVLLNLRLHSIEGTQEWYCKSSQEPTVGKVIDHRWEPSTAIF